MAEIFRPTYTVTDPQTGKKQKRKSRTWWIRYYKPDGSRPKVKGFKDRKATATLAAELEKKAERLASGFTDRFEEDAKRPLREHAEDYRRFLAAKGNTARHVTKTMARVLACLDGCQFIKAPDVQASAVLDFLASLRQSKGASILTANYYLGAFKGFTRWLWKDKRVAADPLAGMSKLANAGTDVRRVRRDYSPDELSRLIDAAQSGRIYRDLSGPERAALYRTAAGTGLRVSELASLTAGAFDLDASPPVVHLEAAYSKNRKQVEQPLPDHLADTLRPFLAGKPADALLWPGKWHEDAAEMIRLDLGEARAEWLQTFQDARKRDEAEQSDFLAYFDAEGRVIDFHALRHTYVSRIVQGGASAKVAQTLARHSTVQLTLGRYAHAGLYDLSQAVNGLPPMSSGPNAPEASVGVLKATGTDGANRGGEGKSGQIKLGPNLGLSGRISGDSERQSETEPRGDDMVLSIAENPGKTGNSEHLSEWPRRDLNPHEGCPSEDFKSPVSAIPPRGRFQRLTEQ